MKIMNMKMTTTWVATFAFAALLAGCTARPSPDVSAPIRQSLDAAGLKSVSVSQDRDKGVVTLSGKVAAPADKAQAESIAKSQAAGQVVADEITVEPPGVTDAGTINSDLDKGISENLDAALRQNGLKNQISYSVKNGVVTLTGSVDAEATRDDATRIAKNVPNVQQVVNELQLKDLKATASR